MKIARIDDLNDPYELLAPRSLDLLTSDVWQEFKTDIHNLIGVLCFTGDWNNLVHWSHYGDKHSGVCLGFDVFSNSCFEVKYQNDRLDIPFPPLGNFNSQTFMDFLFPLMTTKYEGWSYEKERRFLILLDSAISKEEHYFQSFRDTMQLKEVTIGARCDLSGNDLRSSLGELASSIQIYKARLSLEAYSIERDLQ